MHHARKETAFAGLVILLLGSFLFFYRLGDRSFRNPDEGRYAEIAREMVQTGDWVRPQLYGVDYLRKPPLIYWLIAGSFKVFGFSEWAARFVSALFGLLGVLAVFFFARHVFDLKSAIFSSLILATNFWYLSVSRYLLIDAVFAFFIFSALALFYVITESPSAGFLPRLLFYLSLSLAFLAKGPAGLILVAIPVPLYGLITRQFRRTILKILWLPGLLIFLACVLPWFVRISTLKPWFPSFFFLHEHFQRAVSSQFEHQESWHYYLWMTPALLMPWPLFLEPLRAGLRGLRQDPCKARLFLLCAAVGPLLFYSLSSSKLPTYLMPAMPFFALLIGNGWSRWETDENKSFLRMPSLWALILLLFLAFFLMAALPNFFPDLAYGDRAGLMKILQWAGAFLAAGSFVALRSLKARRPVRVFYALIVMLVMVLPAISSAMEAVNDDYTTKPFAAALKPRVKTGDEVLIYGQPGAFYDFGFYLGAPVKLVGLEGELEFSRGDKESERAVVTPEAFRELLLANRPFYCLMRRSDFIDLDTVLRHRLSIVHQDARKVLVSAEAVK